MRWEQKCPCLNSELVTVWKKRSKVADGIKTTDQRTVGQLDYLVSSRYTQGSPRALTMREASKRRFEGRCNHKKKVKEM